MYNITYIYAYSIYTHMLCIFSVIGLVLFSFGIGFGLVVLVVVLVVLFFLLLASLVVDVIVIVIVNICNYVRIIIISLLFCLQYNIRNIYRYIFGNK